jgi:D-serine deaminase-like pyridoxal phosphate-dependent protein
MRVGRLSTPCLLVDAPRFERNLERMQQRARRHGATLRPHVKTHRSASLARRQLARGAAGITVAKIAEAEVFVGAGFEDVRIAYPPVGEDKLRRLLPLLGRARISFCLDDPAVAAAASATLARHGRRAEVLIELDCGYGRMGVPWDGDAGPRLAERIAELPGLELAGVLTHAGQAYHGPRPGEAPGAALLRHARDERDRAVALAARLPPGEVSIGSTPTASALDRLEPAAGSPRVTELRPGNYAFYDRTQVALGAATWDDCALTALATVVHRRTLADGRVRVIVDAGRKVLASDPCRGGDRQWAGHGALLLDPGRREPHPGAAVDALSEEHGWLLFEPDAGPAPRVGERVQIVPNHACTAANTQDRLHLVDGEAVLEVVPVSARGRGW